MAASFAAAASLIEWPERLPAALAPAERAELDISVCDGEERRQLEAQWPALRAAADGSGSSGSGSNGDSRDEDGEGAGWDDDEEDDEDDEYSDKRWRRVRLHAVGAEWERRLRRVGERAARGELSGAVVSLGPPPPPSS